MSDPDNSPSTGPSPLILVVDDIAENIRILGNILAENGFRIAVATNGPQALRIVGVSRPALILLDISMPVMDGYEVCRRLKADETTRDIPIIFLTARVDPEDVLQGFKIGAVDYVTKPFRSAELVARVSTQIQLALAKQELIEKNTLLDQRNTALNELNAAKDRFFSIIAHDLRNPFQGLLGYSGLLLQDFNSLTKEEIHRYISQIHILCDSTFTLLENMLEWSRIQLDRIDIDIADLALSPLVSEAMELLHLNAASKRISFDVTIPEYTMIRGDRKLVSSVLLNLLMNAIKFSHEGGRVAITAARSMNDVVVSIEDNGVGISPADQQKLFRIDMQHSTKGTANEKGTGLGLLLCREMLSKIDGRIWCVSREGAGSSFSFSLPDARHQPSTDTAVTITSGHSV